MIFTPLDWLIISVPFIAVFSVAVYLRRYMRSVADFLAASRTAGRYLMCAANAETGAAFGVVGMEVTSRSGFCLGLWGMFAAMVSLFMAITGWVSYRFRETRSLTFGQFFELRYSRGVRVFFGLIGFFAGVMGFGIMPGVMARFIVYFVGFPTVLVLGPFHVSTATLFMAVLLGIPLLLILSGGQITAMVTDCLEGIISGLFYLAIAVTILFLFSWADVKVALLSGAPGQSYINPFDTSGHRDFNMGYMLIGIVMSIYWFRGISTFTTAAKNAHEARMASILGWWRGFVSGGLGGLIVLAAFTVLHNPAFSEKLQVVNQLLAHIDNEAVRSQMRMPLAIRTMLPSGIRGAFFITGIFGVIAYFSSTLHSQGGGFVQDVMLPFRKTPLAPDRHIFWLRAGTVGVALCAFVFSLLFKTSDALQMFLTLTAAIGGGAGGAIVIGGLYWKKGTTQGAWTALVLSVTLALGGRVVQETWVRLDPWLVHMLGPGKLASYLAAYPDRCPMNSQWMTFYIMAICAISYVAVSLLTWKQEFDLERMLHRGKYSIEKIEEVNPAVPRRRFSLGRLLAVDEHFTLGDKFIAYGIFIWEFGGNFIGVIILVWNLCFWRWPDSWWLNFFGIRGVLCGMVIGFCVLIWLTIGAIRDMIRLFAALKAVVRNDADDGMVRDHHNVGEPNGGTKQ